MSKKATETKAKSIVTMSKERRRSVKKLYDGGTPSLRGTLIKIGFLSILDAVGVFTIFLLFMKQNWFGVGLLALTMAIINFVYLKRGGLPAKYLAPGLVFLMIFQVYVVMFSGYISFTNYGSMHNSDKSSAVNALKLSAYSEVEGGDTYLVAVGKTADGQFGFMATSDTTGVTYVGNTETGLEAVGSATDSDGDFMLDEFVNVSDTNGDGTPDTVEGFTPFDIDQINNNQASIFDLKIPVDISDPSIFLRTDDAMTAYQYKFDLVWDKKTETFTRVSDGAVFSGNDRGFFENESGETLDIGWIAPIGVDNYSKIFTDQRLAGPLAKIVSWTVIFAVSSVVSTFIVGLALALLFNREKMRFKKVYRVIMILPYAFPGFLSAYVWKGLFNTENGFINNVILSGVEPNIQWLSEEGPARIAVLLTNLWLGFPYMFLITTGALQAIPAELTESATIDGATPWQQFRLIKFPLLMVTLAPLLIASFAYNFNNFTLIYLLTGGGPTDISAGDVDAGGTDILITFVYKIAFGTGQGRDYGLASAFSVLIFLVVGTLSLISFRRTKALEDMN